MSSPMTAARLAEIRERAEAATEGYVTDVAETFSDDPDADPVETFIAHARTDVPDLLAEVERLRGSLDDMLETSREMQANVRASVTLAYLQEEIVDILHPMPGESA